MYKPNSYNQKGNMEKKFIQNNGYNLLSPPFNPKSKTIKYFNNNIPKFIPKLSKSRFSRKKFFG